MLGALCFTILSCNKHDDDDWGGNSGGNIWNPTVVDGRLPGLFSVSSDQQVQFSQGNLQYQASTNTWRFAEHQWDYVGSQKSVYVEGDEGTGFYIEKIGGTVINSDNSEISPTYNGWIDLFGWGTSGWNNGNTYNRPWDSDNSDGSLYGPSGRFNLTDDYANAEWGHNAISNGGNREDYCRTLTKEEWEYLLESRTTSSGIRFAKAKVNGYC